MSVAGTESCAVKLRVYDISGGAAKKWSPILIGQQIEGVWHSGIEVFGYEYFYGGGIVKMRPENVEATFGISPSRIHYLGNTSLSRMEFEKFLLSIRSMFTRDVYDLSRWNCNHFTDHCAKQLVNHGIPTYILDLPQEVCSTFMGRVMINFIKMMQGGAAPITIDNPKHPSRMLKPGSKAESGGAGPAEAATNLQVPVGGNRATRLRRNSCPASPSNAAAFRAMTNSAPHHSFQHATANTRRPSVAGKSSRHTQQPLLAMPPSQRGGGAALVDPCGPGSFATQIIVQCDRIGDEQTEVVFSPAHKRLYEMERDKYAAPQRFNVPPPLSTARKTAGPGGTDDMLHINASTAPRPQNNPLSASSKRRLRRQSVCAEIGLSTAHPLRVS